MSTRFCRFQTVAPGVALLIFSAASTFAANAIPNAPTVPPAPVMERPLDPATSDAPGEQPSAQHHWVSGHWRWLEGAYVWEPGRWEIPPQANVVWHQSEWQRQSNGWILKEGYWDEAPPAAATTVVTAPAAPVQQEIIITTPPPPPQREIIVERPSPLHVWIGGHWGWRAGKHLWIGGRWALAPRPNAVWVAPRWDHRNGRYHYVDGYWRDAVVITTPPRPGPPTTVVVAPPPQGGQVVIVTAPPPPRREVAYAPPGPGFIWINGYWAWRGGRYVWIAGRYERPPHGHRQWVEPRW